MKYEITCKIILLYTIAIKFSKSTSETSNELKKLFDYQDRTDKVKEIQLKDEDVNSVLNEKPTGLQRTVLDLDFPEGPITDNNNPRFRIVQCLAIGHVDYIQRKTYRNVTLKLTPREPYSEFTDQSKSCSNTVVVTLSPPGTISPTDSVLTNVYKIFEKKVTLKKNEAQTVVFEDVLDSGFLEVNLFWVNFEITGKCSQYLVVELLKPQNSTLYGDKDPDETRNQVAEGQQNNSNTNGAVSPA